MPDQRSIPAAKFKAQCLALLDEVCESGTTLVITKHGRPVARLVPAETATRESVGAKVEILGDILSPIEDWAHWDEGRNLGP